MDILLFLGVVFVGDDVELCYLVLDDVVFDEDESVIRVSLDEDESMVRIPSWLITCFCAFDVNFCALVVWGGCEHCQRGAFFCDCGSDYHVRCVVRVGR